MSNNRYKFRAWDKKEKKMFNVLGFDDMHMYPDYAGTVTVYDDYRDHEKHVYRPEIPISEECSDADDLEIMQYTGLKDKNGKEIYEGDIVEDDLGTAEVKYKNAAFWIGGLYLGELDLECFKIIGSIYENPELLDNNN